MRGVGVRSRRSARFLGAAAAGYTIGMVSSADLVTRALGAADLRTAGSGNPGAANAAAVLGPSAGLIVMAGDIAKGAIAGRVGAGVAGPDGIHIAASASVIGHCLPAINRFRGGKGVATSVGQVLVGFPIHFPIDAAVALATGALPFWKQRAFAATATASAVWVAAATMWWRRRLPNLWGPPPTVALPVSAAVSSAVILLKFALAAERTAEADENGEGSDES